MMSKFKNPNLIKSIFIIFLMIQPFLDLKFLYEDSVVEFFHFSPSTIIRILVIAFLVIMVFFSKKKGKQELGLLIYTLIVGVYFVFHHINSMNFDANITGTYNYSLVSELFYCLRMVLPIYLIYLFYNIKLTKKEVGKIVAFVTFIFSFVIVISNLFKFGIASYGGGALEYNVIDWFTHSDIPNSAAGCQGLFAGANRLGVLLSALLPINFYFFFTEKSNKKILLILINILGTIMIGTQVSTYTWILVMIVIAILYLILLIIKKIKFDLKKVILFLLIFIIEIPFVLVSPVTVGSEQAEAKKASEAAMIDNDLVNKQENLSGKQAKIEFIQGNYQYYYINYIYPFEIYNFKADPDFWIKIMNSPFEVRNDDRRLQELISDHLYELNDNSLDKLFGMGYSRFKASDLYLEKDFLVHYYTIGLFGILLFLCPYIFIILMSFIYVLKDLKNNFKFRFLVYLCALCMMVLISVLCGHIVDEMVTYIFMAMLSGLLLREIFEKEINVNYGDKKVSIIIPVYNTEEYLNDCFDSVLRQNFKNLEVIVINDCSTDGSLDIIKKYQKEHGFILINNKNNLGLARSRNLGIKKATGDYIVFLDSDDMLYDNNIRLLLENALRYEADLVISKLNSFNSKGEYGYYSDKYIDDYFVGNLKDNKKIVNCISVCSKLYKASLIKDIKFLEGTVHEDNSFTIRAYYNACKIVIIPEHLYYRRVRENENLSIMQKLNFNTYLDLIKNYENVLKNTKQQTFLFKFMIRKANNYVLKHVNESNVKKANQCIIDLIKEYAKTNFQKKKLICYNNLYRLLIKGYRVVLRKG